MLKAASYKKAEMGIGTLIIFIALLLVAAIAAGVLIQTSGSLQEKAISTGDQAKGQIATNIKVVEVSATDGSDGLLNTMEQVIKLAPGSDDIKIEQSILTVNTYDKTASLKYKGVNATFENTNEGYNTWNQEDITGTTINMANNYTLAEDYDDDTLDDILTVNSSGHVLFIMSSGARYGVPLSSVDCNGTNSTFDTTITVNNDYIDYIVFLGACGSDTIWAGNMTLNITPKKLGQGYFSVEYLQRGSNPVAGNLQRGDVVKIYFEAPRDIGEDEKIRINFIPKIGVPTLTEFITPEVISTERVYLYP